MDTITPHQRLDLLLAVYAFLQANPINLRKADCDCCRYGCSSFLTEGGVTLTLTFCCDPRDGDHEVAVYIPRAGRPTEPLFVGNLAASIDYDNGVAVVSNVISLFPLDL
jgi:hypothetical protein